jgi:hypothetical protein
LAINTNRINIYNDRFGGRRITGDFHMSHDSYIVDQVKEFLIQNSVCFGTPNDSNRLDFFGSTKTNTGHLMIFNQLFNSLPVFDAYITVRLDDSRTINWIKIGKIVPDCPIEYQDNEVDPVAKIIEYLKEERGIEFSTPERSYMVLGKSLVPIFILIATKEKKPSTERFIVQRYTGEILSQLDLSIQMADIPALLFDPNPVISYLKKSKSTMISFIGFYKGLGSSLKDGISLLREEVIIPSMDFHGDFYSLSGNGVDVQQSKPPIYNGTPIDLNYEEASFHELMAYYHIYNYNKFINNIIGRQLSNHSIKVYVDLEFEGASFVPDARHPYIMLGKGRDKSENIYGEDGKVILHEYSHFIVDQLTCGHVNNDERRIDYEALSEAYALLLPIVYLSGESDCWTDLIFDWAWIGDNSPRIDRISDENLPKYDEWLDQREPGGRFYGMRGVDNIGGFILAASLWDVFLRSGGSSTELATRRKVRDEFFNINLNLLQEIDKGTTIREAMKQFILLAARQNDIECGSLITFIESFIKMKIFVNERSSAISIRVPTFNKGWLTQGHVLDQKESMWFEKRDGRLYLCIRMHYEGRILDIALLDGCITYPETAIRERIHFCMPLIDKFGRNATEVEIELTGLDESTLSGASVFIRLRVPGGLDNEYRAIIP